MGRFVRENLHLEMSEEKTLITHGHDFAKFLGYEVTIAKGECNKKTKTGATRRVNNGKVGCSMSPTTSGSSGCSPIMPSRLETRQTERK